MFICVVFSRRRRALAATDEEVFRHFHETATYRKAARANKVMTGREGTRELVPPPLTTESRTDMFNRLLRNFENSASSGIQLSTETSYATAVKVFRSFCSNLGLDPFLRWSPQGFPINYDEDCAPLPFRVSALGIFLVWLVSDYKISGAAASGYLSGVRKYFLFHRQDLSSFSHPSLRESRTALRLEDVRSKPIASRLRLAFSHEMFNFLTRHVLNRSTPRGLCTLTAIEFAIVMVCRCSEYLWSTSDHFVRGEDVLFDVQCRESKKTVQIMASAAFEFASYHVLRVIVCIRSAKNDIVGEGHSYSFNKAEISPSCAFCFASDMFACAIKVRPKPSTPFFSHSGCVDPFILSYSDVHNALQRAASYVDADPAFLSRIGTRSLRIAGCTRLAAAGKETVDIRIYMRSKSDSFLRYIRSSSAFTDDIRSTITNPSLVPASDLVMHEFGALARRARRVRVASSSSVGQSPPPPPSSLSPRLAGQRRWLQGSSRI